MKSIQKIKFIIISVLFCSNFLVGNAQRYLINLTIGDGNTSADKTRVVINDEQKLSYESSCDASKFLSGSTNYQIYSIGPDGTTYSINERPLDDGKVKLGYIMSYSGSVTISATRLDCHAILIDKTKNVEHNLSDGPYTFTSSAGTFDNRLELFVFITPQEGDSNADGHVTIADLVMSIKENSEITEEQVKAIVDKILGK